MPVEEFYHEPHEQKKGKISRRERRGAEGERKISVKTTAFIAE
jgi:hypothetical protein